MVPCAELPTPGAIDWKKVLDLAVYHRVHPRVAANSAGVMPEEVRSRIAGAARANAHAALLNLARTREAIQLLESQSVHVIVLKGPLLARELYGDYGLRVAGDIDLLVRESDLPRAARILGDAGYRHDVAIGERSLRRHRRRQHDIAFVNPDRDALIELHADLAQPHYGYRFDLEKWWAERRSVLVGGTRICVLKPEHGYLFAAIHAAKHRWERLDLVCDLAAYGRQTLKWAEIEAEAAVGWMLKTVRIGQMITSFFYGDICGLNSAAKKASLKLIAGQQFYRMEGISFDLRLRERKGDQLRYLYRRLLSAKLEV